MQVGWHRQETCALDLMPVFFKSASPIQPLCPHLRALHWNGPPLDAHSDFLKALGRSPAFKILDLFYRFDDFQDIDNGNSIEAGTAQAVGI